MEKKIIQLPVENKKAAKPSEKLKRTVVSHKNWDLSMNVCDVLLKIKEGKEVELSKGEKILHNELKKKCRSYANQDKKKELFDKKKIIKINEIIDKILDCEFKCFYCKKEVKLLYENIREPLQWSLERIDNDYGHNEDNVEISCLNCNLHRKTMHHERYKFTKEMILIKKD
jgi:hypothetical protein